MLKTSRKMSSVSSHFDVTPSILAMLNKKYELKMPKKVAWMGGSLDMQEAFRCIKEIPLMRNKNQLKEYIYQEQILSNGDVFDLDENMDLSTSFVGGSGLEKKLSDFKAMNAYVTDQNKIIPDSLAIFTLRKEKFTESEIVWINSVYNGQNTDKAYLTARALAFDKEYDRSLLLCRYILSEVPGNIDTRILTGRINAWQGNHDKAIEIFQNCIQLNPEYIDSYSALFDVYFWADRDREAFDLIEIVQQNSASANEIADKIARAKREYEKRKTAGIDFHSIINSPDAGMVSLN
jgi:tetratricopeptide (TPR) repeat protein